jgi:acetoin utilization protein AcuB
MLASELINDLIPPLKTSDSGEKAIALMQDYKVSHLPIVNDEQFLGLISEEDIVSLNNPQEVIGNHMLSLTHPFVYDWQHLYDAIKLMSDMDLTVVPVLDVKETYLGVLSLNSLMDYFADLTAVSNPGAILVLEIGQRNYSLSEIARIVESNDAHILSSYIYSDVDSTKMHVTLKIDKEDITPIIQTFQRFNYTVRSFYQPKNEHDDTMDRFDSFMKYLNI